MILKVKKRVSMFLVNVVAFYADIHESVMFASMDAEKAFDVV